MCLWRRFILLALKTGWQTRYLVITCPLSLRRFRRPSTASPQFPPTWCPCFWTRRWSGPPRLGARGSVAVFRRPSCIDPQCTYRSGSNRYLKFCGETGICAFPVCERSLCFFVAHLYKAGLSSRTVKSYLSAVRHSQISMGLGDPRVEAMPQLEYVSRGMRKLSAGGPSTTRLPITPAILLQLRVVWSGLAVRLDAVMLWAAVCMCFFGFLRAGEAVVPQMRPTTLRYTFLTVTFGWIRPLTLSVSKFASSPRRRTLSERG